MAKKTVEKLEEVYREDIESVNDEISKMDLPSDWTHLGRRKLEK